MLCVAFLWVDGEGDGKKHTSWWKKGKMSNAKRGKEKKKKKTWEVERRERGHRRRGNKTKKERQYRRGEER